MHFFRKEKYSINLGFASAEPVNTFSGEATLLGL
jgi:hypothetical protein